MKLTYRSITQCDEMDNHQPERSPDMDTDHKNFIQQIIPAPRDCYAVFAKKLENGEIDIYYQVVPCFALSINCVDADKEMNHDHTCKPDHSRPVIEPCVQVYYSYHVPISEHRVSDTHFLGLNYGDVKPDEWVEDARVMFEEIEADGIHGQPRRWSGWTSEARVSLDH